MESAELQRLLNATTSSERQRITSEMPVADLNGLLDLAPGDAVIAPPFRIHIVAASFAVTFTLGLFAWLVAG